MLNQITLIGRLVREPELRQVGQDMIPVANFTLAVDRPRRSGADNAADFIPVTAWRSTAEFVSKYFKKGQQVYVTGRLETRSWEKDGEKRYGFAVRTQEVGFADSKKSDNARTANTSGVTGTDNTDANADFGPGDFNDNFNPFESNFGGFSEDNLPM